MRKVRIIVVLCSFLIGVSVAPVCGEEIPAQGVQNMPTHASGQVNAQQRFSGYVPPPPIRHTWPGGYKVIFHEMMNTLMDHIVGQY
ncbi:MAG: hypothetical protein ACP5U1_14660 [Desulfomonilaceae bacterium]